MNAAETVPFAAVRMSALANTVLARLGPEAGFHVPIKSALYIGGVVTFPPFPSKAAVILKLSSVSPDTVTSGLTVFSPVSAIDICGLYAGKYVCTGTCSDSRTIRPPVCPVPAGFACTINCWRDSSFNCRY